MTLDNLLARSIITTGVLAATFVVVAGYAFADEAYLYVNTENELQTSYADTPTEAIVEPTNIMHNSGVVLAEKFNDMESASTDYPTASESIIDGSGELYAYIATEGDMQFITAANPMKAIEIAPGIASNSGVQLIVE